jgi:hypothetical protein
MFSGFEAGSGATRSDRGSNPPGLYYGVKANSVRISVRRGSEWTGAGHNPVEATIRSVPA